MSQIATFDIDGVQYKVGLLDERPDVDHDPTFLLFRGDEEEAVVTVHISPFAGCTDRSHVTLPVRRCPSCNSPMSTGRPDSCTNADCGNWEGPH
jgi:hypothetical protein